MNIAFVCTGEFEPWIYDFIAKKLEEKGHKIYYAGFALNVRKAVSKLNRKVYPAKLGKRAFDLSVPEKNSFFSEAEVNEIIDYDSRRLGKDDPESVKPILKQRTLYYEDFFKNFYNQNQINGVVVWNCFPIMVNTACKTAKKMGIRTVFFENGTLRNTIMIDPDGVNYQSSLTKNGKDFYQNVNVDKKVWDKYFKDYRLEFVHPPIKNKGIMNVFEKLYFAFLMRNSFYKKLQPDLTSDSILKSVSKKIYGKYILKPDICDLPGHFVFLPLQCFSDTQVLINSDYVNDMESFVDLAYKSVREISGGRYSMVVKEHPDDWGRIDYSKIRRKYPDIIWLKKYNIRELIEKSDLVITINSSVGIESLMYHKPVVTLGKSFYNIPGIVHHASTAGELRTAVKAAIETPVDAQLVDKFLYYLRFRYFISGNPYCFDQKGIAQMCKRTFEIIGI